MLFFQQKNVRTQGPGAIECLILYAAVLLYARYAGLAISGLPGKWGMMVFTLGIGVIPLLFSFCAGYSIPVVFRIKLPSFREVTGGLLITAGMFVLVLLVSSALVFVFPGIGENSQEMRTKMAEGNLLQACIAVVLLPAVCEELFFRGFVLSSLASEAKKWVAIVLCGTLFGFLHFEPVQIPFTLAIGIGFSYVAWETRSIIVSILMHGLHNATILMIVRRSASSPGMQPDEALQSVTAALGTDPGVWTFFVIIPIIGALFMCGFSFFCLSLGNRLVHSKKLN